MIDASEAEEVIDEIRTACDDASAAAHAGDVAMLRHEVDNMTDLAEKLYAMSREGDGNARKAAKK